jgi:hypothetical protein
MYGAQNDDDHTGAPGTAGEHAGTQGGANYTVDAYGAYTYMSEGGGSTDTEAQANKYGSPTHIPGLETPKSTGAGSGHTMIGGREVH